MFTSITQEQIRCYFILSDMTFGNIPTAGPIQLKLAAQKEEKLAKLKWPWGPYCTAVGTTHALSVAPQWNIAAV